VKNTPLDGPAAATLPTSLDPTETNVERWQLLTHPFPQIHAKHQHIREHLLNTFCASQHPQLRKRAFKINNCCAFPSLRTNDEGQPVVSLMRCRDRLCPMCTWHQGRRTEARVKAIISEWDQCRHLTLTLRSTNEPLGQQIDLLLGAFRRLRQRDFWRHKVHGGIGTVEITYNPKTDRWHPHLHLLLDGKYIEHSIVSSEWSKVTGGSFVVHVSAVHSRDDAGRYIAKYVSKPSEMPDLPRSRTEELALALAGRRTLITFGTAHNAGLPVRDRRQDGKGSRHVVSVHQVIHAYRRRMAAAMEFVSISSVYLPRMARLVVGGDTSSIDPFAIDASAVNTRLVELGEMIRLFSDTGVDLSVDRPTRASQQLNIRELIEPRTVPPLGLSQNGGQRNVGS
jgi:hypothetical protein